MYESSTHSSSSSLKENARPRTGNSAESSTKTPSIRAPKSFFGNGIPLIKKKRSNLGLTSPDVPVPRVTQWDEFLGEPINTGSGQAAQVKPSNFRNPFGSTPDERRFGVEVSIQGGPEKAKKLTFAERAAKFGKETLPELRPSWKNNTSRAASSNESVKDTAQTHARDVYTAVKEDPKDMSRSEPVNRGETPKGLNDVGETGCLGVHYQEGARSTTSVDTITPLPPLKVVKNGTRATDDIRRTLLTRKPVANRGSISEDSQATPTGPFAYSNNSVRSSSIASNNSEVLVDMSDVDTHEPRSHFSWTTYAASMRDEDNEEGDTTTGAEQYYGQDPVSRFSWTTAATNTTYQRDSLPCSPVRMPQEYANPIMTRRRPVGSISTDSPGRGSMGWTFGGSGESTPVLHINTEQSMRRTAKSASPSSSVDKALPKPPTLDKEGTYIDALQAQSDDLDLRQTNIQRVIAELQKVEHASPLEVDERMRRENRKKLEKMGIALEEVRRERHEVGMKLSRARSRLQQEEGQASSLWLRRVTG